MGNMFSHAEVNDLVLGLEESLRANDAFEHLIGEMADLMEMAGQYRIRGNFEAIAMTEYAYKLQTTILASGHDPRVIRMCRAMLALSGASEQEIVVERDGNVRKRRVYFARRSDGLIKIGSSMNVKQRLAQLSAGTAESLELLGHIDGSYLFEKQIHRKLAAHCKYGEWFSPSEEVVKCIDDLIRAARTDESGPGV